MDRWVMGHGSNGHENRMGHMGHGSLGVDPCHVMNDQRQCHLHRMRLMKHREISC